MKNSSKGITLVALVVTIIILLILAGISIASLTGNGLFEKAKLAKEEHEISAAEEVLKTELMNILANQQGQKDLNNLNGMNVNGYNTQVSNIGKIVTMTKNNESYYFLVDSDYNVQSLNNISSISGSNNGSNNNSESGVSGGKTSTIINDFSIEASKITSRSIQLSIIDDVSTNNGSKVKGYIYFIQGKVIGTSENSTYEINSLEKDTEYTNIYICAIDEIGNLKKSNNVLTVTTPKSFTLIDTDNEIYENWLYQSGSSSTTGNPLSISAYSSSDTVKTSDEIDFSQYSNIYIKAYMARRDYRGYFTIANSNSQNLKMGFSGNFINTNDEFCYYYDSTEDRYFEINIDISNCIMTDSLKLYTWDATMTIYKVILE